MPIYPIVIPATSAVSNSTRYATFRQEVGRILMNTSLHLPWDHKAALLSKFSWRLKVSGYPRGFRSKVISDGIAGYVNTLDRRLRANMPLNRPRELIRSQSRNRRHAHNWFNRNNSGGSEVQVFDTVLFVPATPSSSLAKILKDHEALNNQGRTSRIKVVERAGKSVKRVLAPNNPWEIQRCGDLECFPCTSTKGPVRVSCRVPGVVYSIICVLCEADGKEAFYFGESGKNCYERGRKHLEQFNAGVQSHCMTIHARVHHGEVPKSELKFRMVPLRRILKPLDRQISEALLINNSDADILLNSGSEWRSGQVPRASVCRPVS